MVTRWKFGGALIAVWMTFLPATARAQETAKETPPWDQVRVAKLAEQLYEGCKNLETSVRQELPPAPGIGQRRAHYRLRDRLRLIRSETEHLARALKAGEGREETFHTYRRIGQLIREAREDARRLFLQQPTLERISAAREPWMELNAYYGIEWDLPPITQETPQR